MLTVTEFVAACSQLDSDDIYDLFEYDISDSLRNEILSLAAVDSAEPVREALNFLGNKFNVAQLSEY